MLYPNPQYAGISDNSINKWKDEATRKPRVIKAGTTHTYKRNQSTKYVGATGANTNIQEQYWNVPNLPELIGPETESMMNRIEGMDAKKRKVEEMSITRDKMNEIIAKIIPRVIGKHVKKLNEKIVKLGYMIMK